MRLFQATLAALLVAAVPALSAAPAVVLSGSLTEVSIDGFSEFRLSGGTGVASVFDSLPDGGGPVKSKARATLDVSDGLPVLEVFAESFAGERNFAAARAVQKYVYNGAPTSLTINGLYEGTLTPDRAGFSGEMVVFNEDGIFDDEASLSTFFDQGGFGGLIFEGIFPEDDATAGDANTGPFSVDLSVTFDVEDGDVFWFYATFAVSADGVGTGTAKADGFSTATFSFVDGTGVSVVGVTGTPVPVPAAAWLLLSGLGALVIRRRPVHG